MGISGSRLALSVVGYGYWGPNMARNVCESQDFRLASVCERDEDRISECRRRHPSTWIDREFDEILANPRVEAVAVATPPATHYPLVRQALEAGKHVLVEKPLATTAADAAELVALAERNELVLMPGHTFLYSPPVNKIRQLIDENVLGEIYFVTSSRMNLGKYQRDGVVLDLAPHDLSILCYWLDDRVVEVAAHGSSIIVDGVHETAFLTLTFASGTTANVQISWLAPRKVRQMVLVGSRRMVQYEDGSADESVRIYDRGLDYEPPTSFGEYRLTYRAGDMVAPRVEAAEPLALELADFANAIRTGEQPRSSATFGLEIVLAVEALQESLKARGAPVAVPSVAELMPMVANGNGAHANGNGTHGNGAGTRANGARTHANGNGAHANGDEAHAGAGARAE
jgi:predicted dehydrogenase